MDDEFFDIRNSVDSLHREEQVVIHLKPVASAPILKKTKFAIAGQEPFSTLVAFVKQQIHKQSAVFLYVNASFCPSPEAIIGDLFACYKISGELIINYAVSEAWG